jgi:hypothetical protein
MPIQRGSIGPNVNVGPGGNRLAKRSPFVLGRNPGTAFDSTIADRVYALTDCDSRAHGRAMRETHAPPDDDLSDAEWLRQEHDRRADQIADAASSTQLE